MFIVVITAMRMRQSARPSASEKSADGTRANDDSVRARGQELAAVLEVLFTIEGVEAIGQPVTVIDPGDLRPDFLGFIERLRGGAIEVDEEMLLITGAASRVRRRKRQPAMERVRQALVILCRYATDKGVSVGDVAAVLDEAKRKLLSRTRRSKGRG